MEIARKFAIIQASLKEGQTSMQDEVFLPPQGVDHIRQRLHHLENVELAKIARKLKSISDHGSPAFIILKELEDEVSQETSQLKKLLANAVVVDNRARV